MNSVCVFPTFMPQGWQQPYTPLQLLHRSLKPSSCLSLDKVNCFFALCMGTLLQSLDVFCASRTSCILLKIKCQSFHAFWGYFVCLLLLLPLLLKYHSPLWTVASNTALFHSFQSLTNVLGTKQHFKFFMNSVCVFPTFMTVWSVPLHHKYSLSCTDISGFICYQSHSTVLIVYTAIC